MIKKTIITKISQWGNGYGIRLPKSIVEEVPDLNGCELIVSIKNDSSMLITKNKTNKVRSKEWFVKALKKMKEIKDLEIIDWGKPVGKEIW